MPLSRDESIKKQEQKKPVFCSCFSFPGKKQGGWLTICPVIPVLLLDVDADQRTLELRLGEHQLAIVVLRCGDARLCHFLRALCTV